MSQLDQIAMFPPDPVSEALSTRTDAALWFGLVIDHWQLFDALQDEWLRPPSGCERRVLGVLSFAGKANLPHAGNRIHTHLKLDPARLPRIDVMVRRRGQWSVGRLDEIRAEDEAIVWSGPLPVSAIAEILVASTEERARLSGLARQVSNVALPEAVLEFREGDVIWTNEELPSNQMPPGLELPSELDAVHGALAMAVWAVPRINPWLDLLTGSLGARATGVPKLARAVDAPWWAHPPWFAIPDAAWPTNREERLWLAAIGAFRERTPGKPLAAVDLIRRIAATAANGGTEADDIALKDWVNETLRILRADATIKLDDWRLTPVGKAIQLVFARPMPMSFRTWFDDLPDLPPGIWWSAATLCGLLHGYRRLDGYFRGSATQRRLLAIHALRASDPAGAAGVWAGAHTDSPVWRRQSEQTILSWGGEDFAGKGETLRGRWYIAEMVDPDVRRAAEGMARRNEWLDHDLVLQAAWLCPEGELRIRLPRGAKLEEVFDAEAFRQCIATERGIISALPVPRQSIVNLRQLYGPGRPSASGVAHSWEKTARALPDESAELWRRSDVHQQQLDVPGFSSVPNFLGETDEAELVAIIDKAEWLPDLKRRVQHYGWRYNYKSRQIDASMQLGPLPDWAAKLAKRLAEAKILPHLADQVIVNEYIRDQGISKHVDCIPCFADGIAMISLLESWEMIFRCGSRKSARILERRSIAVMTGDARYLWSHEIPSRLKEPHGLRRQRRISVTFRKVNVTSS